MTLALQGSNSSYPRAESTIYIISFLCVIRYSPTVVVTVSEEGWNATVAADICDKLVTTIQHIRPPCDYLVDRLSYFTGSFIYVPN